MNILPCFFVPQKHIRLHNNRHLLSPLLVPLYQEFLVDPREEHECYYWTALVRCLSSIIPLTLCVSLGTWGVGARVWGWPPNTRSVPLLSDKWRVGLTWGGQGNPINEENLQEKQAWGKWKMRSYQSCEELATRTWRHHISWQKRSAQGVVKGSSIKHVGWALQDGMDMGDCCLFWILEIFLSVKQDRFSFKEIS